VNVKVRREGDFVVGGIGKTADRRPRLFIGERVRGRQGTVWLEPSIAVRLSYGRLRQS
jgi:hypothetical protein